MLPCPIWFWYQHASSAFLMVVFTWSVYGSTYYIDVFGKRFQKELESMKAEVARWHNSSEMLASSPLLVPSSSTGLNGDSSGSAAPGRSETSPGDDSNHNVNSSGENLNHIPLLNDEMPTKSASTTALDGGPSDGG